MPGIMGKNTNKALYLKLRRDVNVSRMNEVTAVSIYQKLKEYLRTQVDACPSVRRLKWLPRSERARDWREPTFQEFINHYNIKIM